MYPVIAEFGPVTIYSYGMMVAIAFLIGIYIARIEAARKNIRLDLAYDFIFYLTIGALAGARFYYLAFFDPAIFIKDPVAIFKIWQGGLAIHGAILGGIIAGVIFSRKRKISFWKIADLASPSLLLGQAIGRIGCFLNGCCFGIPTSYILGVRFPEGSAASALYHGSAVHPAQIYEFILDLAGFFILWALRRRLKFDGALFLIYLMIYSSARLAVSALRGDSLYIWNTNIKMAQVISVAILTIAMVLFKKRKRHV